MLLPQLHRFRHRHLEVVFEVIPQEELRLEDVKFEWYFIIRIHGIAILTHMFVPGKCRQ